MHTEIVQPNPWMIVPFGLLLGTIALAPVLAAERWTRHYAKIALSLGAVTLAYYLGVLQAGRRVLEVGGEYLNFIVLIGSLYVVSGGIHIRVKGEATPAVNTVFLLVGALLANVLGTTGASMLLIRPWIRMNKYRVTAHHIVFFIFLVSNVGGCLTPIGDPPLYLGYLRGIPFWWVARQCWPMWLVAVAFLLAVFYTVDSFNYRRAPREVRAELTAAKEEWRIEGLWNVVFLLVILSAVLLVRPGFADEALMLAAATASWFTTRKEVHEANEFSFHPIREVAILFAGIFATMMPALDWLQHHARELASASPSFFYWGTGLLSSVLDNAPTYLSFLSAAFGLQADELGQSRSELDHLGATFLVANSEFARLVLAISIGAVFFGANTYIGNGPNFMVKAIADHQKVRMPGFLGFILNYSLPVMFPMLVLVWLLFFR